LKDRYGIFYEVDPSIPINENKKVDELSKEKTIIFNAWNYIDDILKSYKYDSKKIWSQFLVDFPRTEIYIEEVKIKNHEELFNPLFTKKDRASQQTILNMKKYKVKDIITVLCNQSTFGFPFTFMHNLFSDLENKKMLSCDNTHYVKFQYDADYLTFSAHATFVVNNMLTGEHLSKIENTLTLEINLNRESLFEEFGLLVWKNVNI
jgi:hypothetical protein